MNSEKSKLLLERFHRKVDELVDELEKKIDVYETIVNDSNYRNIYEIEKIENEIDKLQYAISVLFEIAGVEVNK